MKYGGLDKAHVERAWDAALRLWGVRMGKPELLPGEGAQMGTFAWFGFPPRVHIDPALIRHLGAESQLETVFAHEIGHHVLAPATRIDSLKIKHQMARALAVSGVMQVEPSAAKLANIWADLLINTRIHAMQSARLDVARRYAADPATISDPGIVRLWRILRNDAGDPLMWVYLRSSEILWRLPADSLCTPGPPVAKQPHVPSPEPVKNPTPTTHADAALKAKQREIAEASAEVARLSAELTAAAIAHPEVDAESIATLARVFAHDPIGGALPFGLITAPYIAAAERTHEDKRRRFGEAGSSKTPQIGPGCAEDSAAPTTAEMTRVLGDRRMWEPAHAPKGVHLPTVGPAASGVEPRSGSLGQGLGLAATVGLYGQAEADTVAAAWYRAQAAPHVRPWSTRRRSRPVAELPGPLEQWDAGQDLADLDWAGTLQTSPVIVPGVTTKRRAYLDDEPEPGKSSITLDLYIDSSGSMPHPRTGSPAVLAGAILCLSILKGGGKVRVTSFSGPGDVAGQANFLGKSEPVLKDLLTFYGRGTSFPLDLYGERYRGLKAPVGAEARHVVVLSDDGLTSMFGAGNEQYSAVAATVREVLTTGTLVLLDRGKSVAEPAARAGYDVIYLESMDDAPVACTKLAAVLRG